MFSYAELKGFWHKGLRNGNWYQLGVMERIFYRAATCFAEIGNMIANSRIVAQLREIAEKLKATIRRSIMNAGMERAKEIISAFEVKGVFKWAPQVRAWLKDKFYVLWLGLNSQPPHDNWK